jgi:hypothetical protein
MLEIHHGTDQQKTLATVVTVKARLFLEALVLD